jgi:tryptophan synthase alpha chain
MNGTSKTAAALANNRDAGQGSLIGYFPLGYPNLDASVDAAIAMCQNGVDVLELGIPYSDPVMDGIVIQEATAEALANGFKLKQTFDAIRRITEAVETPILVMTYWNPVIQYGIEKFAEDLSDAGAAGLITPDLIPDEAGEWLEVSDRLDLDRVFLATPTSSETRMQAACELSRGFAYAVSTMGITGARTEVDQLARQVVQGIRSTKTNQNAAVGIGISTTDQVKEVNEYADAAIVGSAFVKAYQAGGLQGLVEKVIELDPKK